MKKLAIIGASYLQFPLVEKAKEMNIETHCFAWEEGAVCKDIADYFYPISILDKNSILSECKKIDIDGIVSIASDAAVPTVSYVANEMGLIANNYSDAFISTNKYEMRKRFHSCGVMCPKFTIASDGQHNITDFTFPLIVKPVDRSGSRGVIKVNKERDLEFAIDRAKQASFSKQAIIEEYISGDEVSVEAISWEGKHYILAITDKVTSGEPYFVELAHHQPSQLSESIQEKIKNETLKALNALNVRYGASHSEFKITKDGDVYAVETGVRMGGGFIGSDLVFLSTGFDFIKSVIEVALGVFKEPVISESSFSGIYFLTEKTKQILPIMEMDTHPDWLVRKSFLKKGLIEAESCEDRSGYFIYKANKKINF